jgi:glycosyltransferase involved in cell wall biosynthesis
MKVVHIISSPAAGGAEVYVKDLILNSKKTGVDASVVFVSSSTEIGTSEAYQVEYISELEKNNIPYSILPFGSRRNPFKGMSAFIRFVRLNNPDVIHSHLLSGIVLAKLFARNTPLFYTHHSISIQTNKILFIFLLKLCSHVIAISNDCKKIFNSFNLKHKLTVIYNAVDLKRLKVTGNLPYKSNKDKNILAIGNLNDAKNYSYMFEIIERIIYQNGIEVQLYIAGEGHLRSKLESIIKKRKLENNVTLLGSRTDIADLIFNADIFLMTSKWEGVPISLLEAQLLGLPAITSSVGGCNEILDITNGGDCFSLNDIDKFVENLSTMLNNEKYLFDYSERAAKNSLAFKIDNAVKEHYDAYLKVVKTL